MKKTVYRLMKKQKSGSGAKNLSNPQALTNFSKKARSKLTNSPVSGDNANYVSKPAQQTRYTGARVKLASLRTCASTVALAFSTVWWKTALRSNANVKMEK